ncbi:hypothetical protein PQX77_005172 [Marasmius sp. AFHP31]|nr:hypothetical protein PQX77_005172 [Marasmius sp. AFHP31]
MAVNAADSTTTYHNELQEHISAFRKHLAGEGDKPFSSSIIEPSGYWTPSEKERFFHSLSVNTRFRPDLIALDVKSKNVTDVCIYLDVLEEASSQAESIRDELDIAITVANSWIKAEEEEAERLEDLSQKTSSGEAERLEQEEALSVLDVQRMKLVDRILQEAHGPTTNIEDASLSQPRSGTPLSQSHVEQEPNLDIDQPEPSQYQPSSSLTIAQSPAPDPEVPLSPASRRRLLKRLYMRRKRADQSGNTVDTSTGKLQPGRKGRRAKKSTLDGGESEDMGIEGETDEAEFRKLEEEWKHLGIDDDALLSRDLGLFHLGALGNLMRKSSPPDDVPSSISATTIQTLDAIVKNFVTDVIHLSIVLREEELRFKGQSKVWHSNDEIWATTVNHALSTMGRSKIPAGAGSVQTPLAERDDGAEDIEGQRNELNTPSHDLTNRLSDFQEPPFFCRIPKEFDESDGLMDLETNQKALSLELDEEMKIEDRDLRLELEYRKELEARYNRSIQQ